MLGCVALTGCPLAFRCLCSGQNEALSWSQTGHCDECLVVVCPLAALVVGFLPAAGSQRTGSPRGGTFRGQLARAWSNDGGVCVERRLPEGLAEWASSQGRGARAGGAVTGVCVSVAIVEP